MDEKKGNIRGAIFDLDGTLLDSMPLWRTLGEDWLRSLGCKPREDLGKILQPLSLIQAAETLKKEYGLLPSPEEILASLCAKLEKSYREEAPLKPGVADFLKRLHENGVKLCIATATALPLAEAALARCGVRDYFDGVFSCGNAGKAEPQIYRQALACLGTDRTDTPVFEDALFALQTAKRDGFLTVAVRDDGEKRQEELKALADFYLESFAKSEKLWEFLRNAGRRPNPAPLQGAAPRPSQGAAPHPGQEPFEKGS